MQRAARFSLPKYILELVVVMADSRLVVLEEEEVLYVQGPRPSLSTRSAAYLKTATVVLEEEAACLKTVESGRMSSDILLWRRRRASFRPSPPCSRPRRA